jgi:raffinose/stachyose/melibiose transport system permease protein
MAKTSLIEGDVLVDVPRSRSGRALLRRGRSGEPDVSALRLPSGFPWILPSLVLCVGLIYYCVGYNGYISTLSWDGITPNPPSVGYHNYTTGILHDPVFWGAIKHTAIFFGATFVAQTFLGLLFAVLLHSKVKLGVVYKVIIFVPVMLAPAIMAPVFREMFSPPGQFNQVLHHLGLGALSQPWIGQSSTALGVVAAITVWEWTGVNFVLYYAAIGQIDRSMIDAARIDGAGNFRVIASIVWPSVRGTTFALATLSVIGALKTFDVPYLVTNTGPNDSTQFLGTYIYQMVVTLDHVGYAAALSIVLLVLSLFLAIGLQVRSRRGKLT